MPKLTFPAAGEAMPAAQEVITGRFSRRAMLVSAIATLPAIGAAAAASSSPVAATEHISERVRRLARELSAALEEWNADIGGNWKAHVYAASSREHPIEFESLDDLPKPDEQVRIDAEVFAATMRKVYGGQWRVTLEHDFALFVQRAS